MKLAIDMELDWSVEYENVRLMSNLMLLAINRNSLEKMKTADLHLDTIEYIKSEYQGYITITSEKIKHELNKQYRLN